MKHTMYRDDIRVVVYPRHNGDFGILRMPPTGTVEEQEAHLMREADRIRSEIERHVDGFSQVLVTYDRRYECGYCNYDTTNEPYRTDKSSPIGCCDEEVADWAKENGDSDD